MKFPNPNMLLFTGIADAYAVSAEYVQPEVREAILTECLKFTHYVPHPRYDSIPPGSFTDDTEMSVANAKTLIANSSPSITDFANAYVTEFNIGGRRKGYSRKFQQILESSKDGASMLMQLEPHSSKNGAAMRAAPFGVIPSIMRLLDLSAKQARVTHDTAEGVFSAQTVALMSHYGLYEEGPLSEVSDFCLSSIDEDLVERFGHVFTSPWPGGPVDDNGEFSVAITTVHAVVDALKNHHSLMSILKQVLLWGGDTDSVAAIAWAIASARYQDEVLPEFMTRDLERAHPETGPAYLNQVGQALIQHFSGHKEQLYP